jgi:hypothetical protein
MTKMKKAAKKAAKKRPGKAARQVVRFQFKDGPLDMDKEAYDATMLAQRNVLRGDEPGQPVNPTNEGNLARLAFLQKRLDGVGQFKDPEAAKSVERMRRVLDRVRQDMESDIPNDHRQSMMLRLAIEEWNNVIVPAKVLPDAQRGRTTVKSASLGGQTVSDQRAPRRTEEKELADDLRARHPQWSKSRIAQHIAKEIGGSADSIRKRI